MSNTATCLHAIAREVNDVPQVEPAQLVHPNRAHLQIHATKGLRAELKMGTHKRAELKMVTPKSCTPAGTRFTRFAKKGLQSRSATASLQIVHTCNYTRLMS